MSMGECKVILDGSALLLENRDKGYPYLQDQYKKMFLRRVIDSYCGIGISKTRYQATMGRKSGWPRYRKWFEDLISSFPRPVGGVWVEKAVGIDMP